MTENMDKKKRFRASKPGGDFLEKSLIIFHVFEHLMKPQVVREGYKRLDSAYLDGNNAVKST